MACGAIFQVSVDSSHRKLKTKNWRLVNLYGHEYYWKIAILNRSTIRVTDSYANCDRLKLQWTTRTCNPARADRETAFAFALPESLPALPPAYNIE